MKQIVCEMCGGKDVVKQDGLFVCQNCGTKYSLEEAKKMMVEGTVKVDGAVKIDQSEALANLYTIARRARDAQEGENAERYYNEILMKDPNSWEANFYLRYFQAWNADYEHIYDKCRALVNIYSSTIKALTNPGLLTIDEISTALKEINMPNLYYHLSSTISEYYDRHVDHRNVHPGQYVNIKLEGGGSLYREMSAKQSEIDSHNSALHSDCFHAKRSVLELVESWGDSLVEILKDRNDSDFYVRLRLIAVREAFYVWKCAYEDERERKIKDKILSLNVEGQSKDFMRDYTGFQKKLMESAQADKRMLVEDRKTKQAAKNAAMWRNIRLIVWIGLGAMFVYYYMEEHGDKSVYGAFGGIIFLSFALKNILDR